MLINTFMKVKQINKEESAYRFEKKFQTFSHYMDDVISFLRISPAGFSEIYKERKVNSIYFDTLDFQMYLNSIHGNAFRRKIRLRWYDNARFVEPIIEIKEKNGTVGRKLKYETKKFDTKNKLFGSYISSFIENVNSERKTEIFNSKIFFPVLMCSYHRRYFLSSNSLTRITIDYAISYNIINSDDTNNSINEYFDNALVIECKFDSNTSPENILENSFFPFFALRSSKYSNGIDYFYS